MNDEFKKQAHNIVRSCVLPDGETDHDKLIEVIASFLFANRELRQLLEQSEKKLSKLF